MTQVNFWTAVTYGNQPTTYTQKALENVDHYFYLGGGCCRRAEVIEPGKAVLCEDTSSPLWKVALKVASYALVIPVLVALVAKIILRSIHSFDLVTKSQKNVGKVPEPVKETEEPQRNTGPQALPQPSGQTPTATHPSETVALEERLNLEGVPQRVSALMKDKILPIDGVSDEDIQWLESELKTGYKVFALREFPQLIFKMSRVAVAGLADEGSLGTNDRTLALFNDMMRAGEVVKANHLGKLVVPLVARFYVDVGQDQYLLIAQQRLDCDLDPARQEELYRERVGKLGETTRQLTQFILAFGWSDVSWRTIPLLNQREDQIALIDVKKGAESGEAGAQIGIYGSDQQQGLIRCLFSEESIDQVIADTKDKGVDEALAVRVKGERMQEIQEMNRLYEFYQTNGILERPDKPLHVATRDLELDTSKTGRILNDETKEREDIDLAKVAHSVVQEIVRQIRAANKITSVKKKRTIVLDTSKGEMFKYANLGIDVTQPNQPQKSWLDQILNALKKRRLIFNFSQQGNEYVVQA